MEGVVTAKLPFTEATVRRAIRAAQKAGLKVRGIRPDGTVLVCTPGDPEPEDVSNATLAPDEAARWADIEA
jgi:hypothetical protein